ncbi:FGGY-family carbohydrate kinase [Streptococcus sp. zg-JUN1979]|uniref:FGGY-family carbohydrate kinase n=1 Tax=Streptococcus sp. zg-JUN1979 TaxID=3391450 RepID=UPI0039A65E30
MSYYMSIDYGGTNTKVILFDDKGQQIAVSSFETLRLEDKTGYREVDLLETWQAISQAIRNLMTESSIIPSDIRAIACIGHGKGLYVLDKEGREFCKGILSTDTRANDLAEMFEKDIDKLWPKTRQHVVGVQNPVLLRWLKENKPQDYAQIGSILSAKDYIRFKLTGKINQEYGDASGNHWINFETGHYDASILDFFGIAEMIDCLPPLVDYKEIVGGVSQETASLTGLVEGTPVIGGLFDIDACAIGSGVLDSQTFSVIAGTWNINTYPSLYPASQDSGQMNSYFPDRRYLIEGSSATSAGNLDIMLKLLMADEIERAKNKGKSIYEDLESFLEHTDASYSKLIFLPFLYGSNSHVDAKSCFLGLTAKTSKSEMIRAVYEGVCFAHKQHIEQMVLTVSSRPHLVRLSGGASNSPQWLQMFADSLSLPVECVEATELGGLGGAIAAHQAIYGVSLEDAVSQMVRVKKRFEPRLSQSVLYEEKYEVYQALLKTLWPTWEKVHGLLARLEEIE